MLSNKVILCYILILAAIFYYDEEYKAINAFGMLSCMILSLAGNTNSIKSIGSILSGTSILVPRVGFKSFVGIVMSELNTLLGMVFVWMILNTKVTDPFDCLMSATAGIIVGFCNYYSSTAVGMLTSSLTIMDAKDKTLFSKLIVLELLASTMGVFGFVLGIFMRQRIGSI
ncbi:hypothetical protein H312_03226 [Anncaliia algerae PRA339]|uniref:V-ATPase proteolipid subunit C-like domain-containing protein n=1 Tax=Anncaliia algerae PRA339 TaxID=1288291 RepID=A0A059EWZ0_9MICR|nr:hypothetical protein H312_03226 [Anncaliia algerae PRA339]